MFRLLVSVSSLESKGWLDDGSAIPNPINLGLKRRNSSRASVDAIKPTRWPAGELSWRSKPERGLSSAENSGL